MSPRVSLSEVLLRTQTDERLCALAGEGHQRAFAVIVERHRDALVRTAARTGAGGATEDVVQEALLRAWRALGGGIEVRQAQAWLHQIVRNTAINHFKRERGADLLPDELIDPGAIADRLADRDLARDLLAELAALPKRQRAALIATELGGRSRREIAADLGLSEGAVRQLVHRARNSLRVAVTAITPYPLAAWLARRPASAGLVARLAGIAPPAGSGRPGLAETLVAGSAASGGALLKGGAVLLAAGALGGGVVWHAIDGHARHRPAARSTIVRSGRSTPRAPGVTAITSMPSPVNRWQSGVGRSGATGNRGDQSAAGRQSGPGQHGNRGAGSTGGSRVNSGNGQDGNHGAGAAGESWVSPGGAQRGPGGGAQGPNNGSQGPSGGTQLSNDGAQGPSGPQQSFPQGSGTLDGQPGGGAQTSSGGEAAPSPTGSGAPGADQSGNGPSANQAGNGAGTPQAAPSQPSTGATGTSGN